MAHTKKQPIMRFLDGQGRVKQMPSKLLMRRAVLLYLHAKFETDKDYSEKEVNALLAQWSTIGDYVLLRRELVDSRLLLRLPNGSRYWKNIPEWAGGSG